MKKVAVLLSGISNSDNGEYQETLDLFMALNNFQCRCDLFSLNPNKTKALQECAASEFDALAISAGSDVGTVLSTWNKDKANYMVLPEVANLIQDFHRQSKPIAALGLASVLVAKALKTDDLSLTTGSRKNEAGEILAKMNVSVEDCPPNDYITDRYNKILTTPCSLHLGAKPDEILKGISGLVREFVEMA
jgi:enhancing lycopene biosynthesis protein 2